MKEEQINKIIYDYMGDWTDGCPTCGYPPLYSGNYTESLDALVPVVERLGFNFWGIDDGYGLKDKCTAWKVKETGDSAADKRKFLLVLKSKDESPSLALATACAKVIKELDEQL